MTAPWPRPGADRVARGPPRVTPVQRSEGGLGCEHARQVVGDGHARPYRWSVRFAGQVEQSPVGDAEAVEAGPLGVGAVLAEGADAHQHESGVERVGAQSPVLHGPGPEVLAHDVRRRGQAAEELLALGGAQIARHALAPATLDRPEQRIAVDERSDGAHEVTASGLLHLHDVGAPLTQQARAERRTDPGADVDHPQALERARHVVCQPCPGVGSAASPRSRAAKTSFIEPICLRSSSAESAVAVLWTH